MSINTRLREGRYIFRSAQRAKNILSDESTVRDLIGSASAKIESGGSRLTSMKNDLGTLLELLKAWISGDYRELPWTSLLMVTGAVIYFVNPFDAIPDILPASGLLDDAGVISFVLASMKSDIENFRKWQSNAISPDASF